ncbi:MAG: hypothetical protein J5879_04510 [Clostridia bacterium]|nr:hypothetical protein [Clostridia bacterium]
MKCPYCGSERIEEKIAWGKTVQTGNVGLRYDAGMFVGVAQVWSDLCLDCKTVIRTYITDDTNRKWSHLSPTINMFGQ